MKFFVTGGAGFIGSNLVAHLVDRKYNVMIYDNLKTGKMDNLKSVIDKIEFVQGSILSVDDLIDSMSLSKCDCVVHLAANADVRHGTEHPKLDLETNTIGTYNVLEAMRRCEIKKIIFSSTGSVYGEAKVFPTPEDAPLPIQTSLYGASKLACEGLIEAYCEGYNMQSWIFRFVSVLGPKYSHGHVIDFYQQLLDHPEYLDVMGNGTQTKSYIHVNDCIKGMIHAYNWSNDKVNIFNLGTNETVTVNESIRTICDYMRISPDIKYSGGNKGWIGDNPLIHLDTTKIESLSWKPKYSIKESIIDTVRYLSYSEY